MRAAEGKEFSYCSAEYLYLPSFVAPAIDVSTVPLTIMNRIRRCAAGLHRAVGPRERETYFFKKSLQYEYYSYEYYILVLVRVLHHCMALENRTTAELCTRMKTNIIRTRPWGSIICFRLYILYIPTYFRDFISFAPNYYGLWPY